MSFEPFNVGSVTISPEKLFLIAGPCVIESEEHVVALARKIAEIARGAGMDLIFKASYDKANRTSFDSFRGPGLKEGLRILARVKNEIGAPILSDVHETGEVEAAAEVLDILQIPAFLCRQTDLIAAAVGTGRCVNIKKGQFLAPWDMANVVEKARSAPVAGTQARIMVTERGVSFGYNNLVSDMRSLVEMAKFGCPVVYDATHSVQMPGGAGKSSGGRREYIEPLLRGAVAVGVNGVFMEVHDDPANAKSDGPNQLPIERLGGVIRMMQTLDAARKSCIA
ncbi:3-deoxy-8-phosphooctulonate synthase [Candidatus Sumerlaeota bacterium]|nr:3-deoxy-8-phosphooctulonate synthase [Candidatus Sumerlaeota bacterium]